MRIKPACCVLSLGLVAASLLGWSRSRSEAQEGGLQSSNRGIRALESRSGPNLRTCPLPCGVLKKRTWLKLHTTAVPLHKTTSLGDLIRAIKAATKGNTPDDAGGIPVFVDPLGLQMADKTMDSPIEWDVEGLPLSTSLPLMLKQLGLRFNVMSSGLLLISATTDQDIPADPSALILDDRSMSTDEVRTLRAEVLALRRAGNTSPQNQPGESRCLRL